MTTGTSVPERLKGWGAETPFQIAMLHNVLNEDELDEWYAD